MSHEYNIAIPNITSSDISSTLFSPKIPASNFENPITPLKYKNNFNHERKCSITSKTN